MKWPTLLNKLSGATASNESSTPIRHRDIEIQVLAESIRTRPIHWSDLQPALDKSIPYDIPRPRQPYQVEITIGDAFGLLEVVPPVDRNFAVERLDVQLAGINAGTWSTLDALSKSFLVKNENLPRVVK